MSPIFAVGMIVCVAAIQAQMVPGGFPSMAPAPIGVMPQPLGGTGPMANQYLYLSAIYGTNVAKLYMAEQTAQYLGNSPQARLYAGRLYDMPKSWWLTSASLNGQAPPAYAALAALD